YPCEEHSVRTTDGTILKLWRIPNARHGTTRYSDEKPTTLPGVILWHGLGLSSASWVCNPSSNVHENFAFVLADSGFDVWLVDGRVSNEGGKKRWDFGIDEISYIDVPAVVDYVLNTTGRKTVSYVGFSQGTATAFAALSVSEELNRKINVFIALAPCIQPALPENTVIQSLINLYGPKGIYRILGSNQFLGTARKLIHQTTPHIHSMAVRKAFEIIFGWNCSSFGCHDRQAALLSHAFGRLPVKNVVQWFQIIKENNALLHYQEHEEDGPFDNSTQQRTTPTKYPLKHISTKLYLFAGSIDNLCHISEAKHHLPPHAQVKLIKNYNHLDLIWATDAKEKVWDYIIPILR
ncbi:Alpha/Beta hydrolase protein, partial [Obelidium mucronatum]